MIVTVARNDQLRKKLRSAAGKDILLVLSTGKIIRPLKLPVENKFCKRYLIAFDIPSENMVPQREDFSDLEQDIKKTFPKRIERRILELLSLSQRLTVVHVSKDLEIARDVARQLVTVLVKWGAYIKYYHHWRRTPAFAAWIKKRVEV